jgi:uncharacterized FlaG/YvyC family protein
MDVQALTATISTTGPSSGGTAVAEAPAVQTTAVVAATAVAPVTTATTGTTSSSTPAEKPQGISPAVARIFGSGAPVPQSAPLNVSYRVVKDPNEIVIVFTDPNTGKEVAQFPPDLFAQLAQMLDHQRGATLDQNA